MVENVNILVNSNGQIIRSDVVGALKMRTYLRYAILSTSELLCCLLGMISVSQNLTFDALLYLCINFDQLNETGNNLH